MKKLFTFVMALVAVMTMNATVVTLNASDFTAVGQSAVDQTVKGVRVQITNGLINSSEVRIYKNATITITATEEMSAVVFHCTAPGTVNYGPGNFTAVAGYTYYKKAGITGLKPVIYRYFHVVELNFNTIEQGIVISSTGSDLIERIDHLDDAVKDPLRKNE